MNEYKMRFANFSELPKPKTKIQCPFCVAGCKKFEIEYIPIEVDGEKAHLVRKHEVTPQTSKI